MGSTIDELRLLIRSRHPVITIETDEERRAIERVRAAAGALSMNAPVWNLVDGLRVSGPNSKHAIPETQKAAGVLAHILAEGRSAVYILADLCVHLKDPTLQRLLRSIAQQGRSRNQTLVLIDSTTELPQALRRLAVPFDIPLPDEKALKHIVRSTYKELSCVSKIRTDLTKDQFRHIIRTLRGLTADEARLAVSRVMMDDDCLNAEDIERLLEVKRDMIREGGLLEYIDPRIGLEDLAGLSQLKEWLAKRRGALTEKARKFGLEPPRGLLLLGVQGCGKSAICKATAAAWQMPLLRLDPGRFYDKYVGESERNLRRAIKLAESMAPVVLWIDEIEKAFASAAADSADGGLSKRMFGTLLSWLQEHRSPIFCVATANDISALPPELMRKGRFDEVFFVDLPETEVRGKIAGIHLTARKRDPANFDLDAIAAASAGFSGAEIEQAVVAGLYAAFAEGQELTTSNILDELAGTRPLSVTMAERIAELRAWADTRCVSAN
ncbi:MAG: AAA family ATPase [Planctomycetes bacterium]|nr:AAA family ATPase [Planctomycetota bacterium]